MIKKLLLVIFMSFVLSGCIPSIVQNPGGVAADKSEFTKGGVPNDFPKLPFYPDAKVIEGYSSALGSGASAISDDNLEKVADFYNKNLSVAGWEFNVIHKEALSYVFEVKDSQYNGVVIVNTAADGKKTAITFSVAKR